MIKSFDSWTEDARFPEGCPREYRLALKDSLNVLDGKWKLQVLGALITGKRRFSEIEKSIPQINPRMLSRELKDLENNGILHRKTHDNTPVTVEYELTPSGKRLQTIFEAMIQWGIEHRKEAMGKP